MQKVNVEVNAYTFDELKLDAHRESMKEMRRIFGKDTLEALADQAVIRAEQNCLNVLNTEIEVCISALRGEGSLDVDVHIIEVGKESLPSNSKLNLCPHAVEAVNLVEDIQLFSKVVMKLQDNCEHMPAQAEMGDLIDIRNRELSYEIAKSIEVTFRKDMDQIQTEDWSRVMAVQGGLLFTKEGKVIEGAINYNQSTGA